MSRLSKDLKTVLGRNHEFYLEDNRNYPEAGWNDIVMSLATGKAVGSNVPDWNTYRDGIKAWEFSATATDELWINFHIEHDYMVGSPMYPHIHFSTNNTATGVIRWGLEYTYADREGTFPASTTIYLEYDVTASAQYEHLVVEATDAQAALITGDVDGLCQMRVFRDGSHANDTFSDAVFGLTADIHYQVNKFCTLNKAAPFNG